MTTDSAPEAPDVTRPVSEAVTAVGVDLGVKRLLVAAPADTAVDVPNALVFSGGVGRDLYNGLKDTLVRLDGLGVDTTAAERQAVESYRSLLHQRFALAALSLVEYADSLDADVVALEDIEYGGGVLDESARTRAKAAEWMLPTLRTRLEATLAAEGFRPVRVDAAYTTQQCHVCGALADVSRATISCDTHGCPVDTVCRDRSAATVLAQRAEKVVDLAAVTEDSDSDQ